jgi:hypothetical protein
VTAEGKTERIFVKQVLAPHLAQYDIVADARSVLTGRDRRASREHRGGIGSYKKAREDILTWLKQDNHRDCRFTTMFDLYALPNDFPGCLEAREKDPYERVRVIERSIKQDIMSALDIQHEVIPYIQLHEFEALILADPQQLRWEYLEHDHPIGNLISKVGDENPELIDDGPTTAPSKRIIAEIPEYDKATAGVAVAEKIGMDTLRQKCRHFNEWITRLEQLGA